MVKFLLSILQMLQVHPDNHGVLRAYPLVMPGVNYSPRAHHLTQELCSELVSSKDIDLLSEVKDMSVAELTDYNNTLAYQDRMNDLLAARTSCGVCQITLEDSFIPGKKSAEQKLIKFKEQLFHKEVYSDGCFSPSI